MGNVSLKVLEKSLSFLFKNGYKPWTLLIGSACLGLTIKSSMILRLGKELKGNGATLKLCRI